MIKVREVQVNSYVTASKLPDADYVINPYIGCPHKCIYCYAEFMKRFTGHMHEEWGDFVDIKICNNRVALDRLEGSSILFGSVTDAYNQYEKKYKITRKILSEFVGFHAKIDILTKSDLVVRDIDLLKKIPDIRVGFSINSLDEEFLRKTEPFASSALRRIRAMQTLRDSGIRTYLFMSPIFPGITKFVDLIEAVDMCSDSFYFENLNLRGAYMPRVFKFIANNYPEHIGLYEKIYNKKDKSYWADLSDDINEYCVRNELDYKLYFYHEQIKKI